MSARFFGPNPHPEPYLKCLRLLHCHSAEQGINRATNKDCIASFLAAFPQTVEKGDLHFSRCLKRCYCMQARRGLVPRTLPSVRPSSPTQEEIFASSASSRVRSRNKTHAMSSATASVSRVIGPARAVAGSRRQGRTANSVGRAPEAVPRSARFGTRSNGKAVVAAAVADGLEPGMGLVHDGPTAVSRIVEVAPSWQQLRVDHISALSGTMGTGQAKTPDDMKARCLAMSQLSDGTTWEVRPEMTDLILVASGAVHASLCGSGALSLIYC